MKLVRSTEKHIRGARIRDIILGGQDGLVNVLGLVLGVATATNNVTVVIVAALAATFAETISMAAVAYTSSKAEKEFYMAERAREEREVRETPEAERQEIREIYRMKGFRGNLLEQLVRKITSNRKTWVDTMMVEELQLSPKEELNPLASLGTVFMSTLLGSLVPLVPFLFLSAGSAMPVTIVASALALFGLGMMKARVVSGSYIRSGLESLGIGLAAAGLGYVIGSVLGQAFGTSAIAF